MQDPQKVVELSFSKVILFALESNNQNYFAPAVFRFCVVSEILARIFNLPSDTQSCHINTVRV